MTKAPSTQRDGAIGAPASVRAAAAEHFHVLDALRGVAALVVVLLHLPIFGGQEGDGAFRHGYLAVDFFFILSGFVVAHAYEHRLKTSMLFGGFALRRLIRLYPLTLAGLFVGAVWLLSRYAIAPDKSDPLNDILATLGVNAVLIPHWWQSDKMGDVLFPANGPMWSLFFELVMNLVWALGLYKLSTRALFCLSIICGTVFLVLAMQMNNLDLGWKMEHAWAGPARVGFGFFLGAVLCRLRVYSRFSLPGWPTLVISTIVLLAIMDEQVRIPPEVGLFLICPAIVWFGAHAREGARLTSASHLLGGLSYPIYTLHLPIIFLAEGARDVLIPWYTFDIRAGLVLIPIVVASWMAWKLYDEPVRGWLTRQLVSGQRRRKAGALATASS